jgi:hypothetical protein
MSDIMKGASIKGVTRPSKDFGEGRECRSKDCVTKLSRYNRREFCFAHAPVKYPRVRGPDPPRRGLNPHSRLGIAVWFSPSSRP